MLPSLLIGLAAGARSLTPLAVVSAAARRGGLPTAPDWLGRAGVAFAIKLLAGGELWGDKLQTAPDRIVPAGLAARVVTGGLAGAAVAARGRAGVSAVVGATSAVAAAYLTFALRRRAIARFGQTWTGVAEDALTAALAAWAVRAAARA